MVDTDTTAHPGRASTTMRQMNLRVAGMGCRRCVREVTARLRDVPGVETIAADTAHNLVLLSGTMTVRDVLADTTYVPALVADTVINPDSV